MSLRPTGTPVPGHVDLIGSRLQQTDIDRRRLGGNHLGADQILWRGSDLNLDRVSGLVDVGGGFVAGVGKVPGQGELHGDHRGGGDRVECQGDPQRWHGGRREDEKQDGEN